MVQRTVVFVCPHGAGKSRLAAAWFNGSAPTDWWATTAGISPQTEVSQHAPRLLDGTAAAVFLDTAPPRALTAVPMATVVVAIDCPADSFERTVSWQLDNQDFDEAMAAELQQRAQDLARVLGGQRPHSQH
ncbi:MAG: hypothetical protein M3400_12810 [Actinomycetota bacterium]|nr:hypothetical protein [Actinomycetota bacterium]